MNGPHFFGFIVTCSDEELEQVRKLCDRENSSYKPGSLTFSYQDGDIERGHQHYRAVKNAGFEVQSWNGM